MSRSRTTRQIVEEIRNLIDETNRAELDDSLDVVPAINRALEHATDILSVHYPACLRAVVDTTILDGETSLPVPDDCFAERIEQVQHMQNGYPRDIPCIDASDATQWQGPVTGNPVYYYIEGQELIFVPAPAAGTEIRRRYIREAGPMALEHGRITLLNTVDNYVVLTDVEDEDALTADIASEDSFVNVCDGRTGAIKATLQIASIDESGDDYRLGFRSTPTQETVQGRTVSGSIPATVAKGDYLCPVEGTCIPPMRSPVTNYLVASSIADIQAIKFGGDANIVMSLRDQFEKQVKRTWAGRQQSMRVKQKSSAWSSGRSRFTTRVR